MEKDLFKKLIVEWLERKLPELIERDLKFKPAEDITAVIGPRRVGKTYFMFQIIKELLKKTSKEGILFIDFEDNRLTGLKANKLDDLFLVHKELSEQELKYLFFDEIQEIEGWSKFVRRLHSTRKYRIIISGSSSKLLGKEIATELRGRYKTIFVAPFSFKEFLHLKKFEYTPKIEYSAEKGTLLRRFKEYLEYGGYPEIIKESDLFEKKEKINSYYDAIFYKDIVERHKITNYEIMEMLMNYLVNNPASVFSISNFEKVLKEKGLKVSKKTISLYLKYLEEAFFVYALEEFSYSARKRIMRPKKIYLVDNALVTFLSSQFSPDTGKLLENTVVTELKRQKKEAFFFKGKKECDFVLKERGRISQAIQVCYSLNEKNKERELKGLLEAMDYFKLKEGIMLTYEQEDKLTIKNKKIKIVPVWKWLLFNTEFPAG
ncbi:MAG: ATP-binding protein [Nanoarchaeota archaeon]